MLFSGQLALATLAVATPYLTKRCSPVYDPEYYGGYLPPVACWQDQDTACEAYIMEGTEMHLDSQHGLAIIYGVSSTCEDTIKEEVARVEDGRMVYGWLDFHGTLTLVQEGVLVISGMSEEAIGRYEELVYYSERESEH